MSHFTAFQRIMLVLNLITTLYLMGYSQSTYFVTPSGAGMMDGSSWNNASDDLQDMINTAIEGDQIWVAQGTYLPTVKVDFDNSGTAETRETIFYINKNIAIYGGFAGSEALISERDWTANPTILSGNIGVVNDDADNSYHVVIIEASQGIINSDCILDGFYIRYGNANGSTDLHEQGGGLYLDGRAHPCRPTLNQLSIAENIATYGGGIYCDAENGECSPHLTYCKIDSNQATKDGGGIYFRASGGTVTADVNNTQFQENSAANYGGAIYHFKDQVAGSCIPEYSNCLFILNAAAEGGGMASESQNGLCLPTFRNATFFNNSTSINGGAIYNRQMGGTCTSRFYNSILWANQNQITNDGGASVDLEHSIYDDGNPNNTLVYPTGVFGDGSVSDLDPAFRDPANLDLRVMRGSPAINTGDNTEIGVITDRDLDGKPRIIQGTVDMGPYESYCPLNDDPILVDIDATGDQIGTSWAHALPNLQEGIDLACDCDTSGIISVWVAEGTYYPTFKIEPGDERTRTFYISRDIRLYGGFQGDETLLAERDWQANMVILSGNIGLAGTSIDNSYHVMTLQPDKGDITSECIVDGFNIERGQADGTGQQVQVGGGLFIQGFPSVKIDPQLRNLSISHNFALFGGGGIYHSNAAASFINSTISLNDTEFSGGGVYNQQGSPWFQNCVIQNNSSDFRGGGFYHEGTERTRLYNCAFIYNEVDNVLFGGGAIFNDGTSPGVVDVINSILWKNQDEIIQNGTASTILGYCIFDDDLPDGSLTLPAGVQHVNTIDVDPLFLHPGSSATPIEERNLRLSQNSPGINNGFSISLETNIDLDGNERVISTIDIGPYENPYAGCSQTLRLDNVLYTPLNGTYQAQQSIQLGSGMEILNTAQVTLNAPEVHIDESSTQLGAQLTVLQDGCQENIQNTRE